MWINRIISSKIESLSKDFPVVVVTGARQVGKTSLLNKLFPSYNFVSLDLPSNAEMAETNPDEFLKRYPAPVVIDEVQYAPKLFRYLKIAVDRNREAYGQYILTGSQKFTLMNSVSDSLAGRCGICELETLSYKEVVEHNPKASIENMMIRGGFPELHKRPELNKNDYFSAYVATYLERDVRSLLKVNQLRDFERFLRACALRTGSTINKSELARDVGISSPTANEWLAVLQASNQIELLEPWFSNKTKSMIKSPKLYFCDTGLLCFLLSIKDESELIDATNIGAIWETFVFSELRKVAMGEKEYWFWRDKSGLEVDFLSHSGGRYELLEAKWSATPSENDARNIFKVGNILGVKNITSSKIICRTQAPFKISGEVKTLAQNIYPLD